jgi:hypothetical protein
MRLRIPKGLRCSKKGIITMAKKKSAKASGDIERKRAGAKAHVKKLQKAHQKISLELRKLEKGLASPMLILYYK